MTVLVAAAAVTAVTVPAATVSVRTQALPQGAARSADIVPAATPVEAVRSDVAARQDAVRSAVRRAAVAREAALAEARQAAEAAAAERASRAERERLSAVLPIQAAVTSPFGQRWGRLHAGTDFGAPVGTPVRAVLAGTVETVERARGGYGLNLTVRFSDGALGRYAHLSSIDVEVGAAVAPGTPLGRSGNTGSATGPNLHFELRGPQGPFDARPWLAAKGLAV